MAKSKFNKTTAKATAKRTKAQRGEVTYHEMSAALRKACDQIRKTLSRSVETDMIARHKVGEIVKRVMDNEDKYGKKSVPKLGRVLGLDTTGLYDAAKVAGRWSSDEVREILGRQDRDVKKNVGISWSHLVRIAPVKDKKDRERLLRETLGYGWSVRDLQMEIAEAEADNGAKTQGMLGDLQRFEKMSEAGESKIPSWDELFVDTMDDPSDEVSTPEALEILRSIQTRQLEIKARCERNLDQVKVAIAKIKARLEARGENPEPEVEAA